jgi:hypothetical protein
MHDIFLLKFIIDSVVLGGVMVIVLAVDPRFADNDEFLRAIKIRSTISFGGK